MPAADGDVLRITAVTQFTTLDLFNNVYFFENQGVNVASDDAIMGGIAQLMDDIYTLINGSISSNLAYVNIIGQNITADRLLPTKAWPDLTVGGSVTSMVSTQVAANVYWRTLRPKTRATKFFPGYSEDSVTGGGALGALQVVELEALGDALLGLIVTADAILTYGAYNAAAVRFTPVEARVVPARTRTQRRRRLGVGS